MASALKPIHKSKQLRYDSPLNLAMHLFSVGGNRVKLIYENDGRTIFLGLFECLTKVALGLTSHFAHDLRSVDQKEESSCLVGDSPCNKGLSRAWGAEEKHSSWRLYTKSLKELGMSKRKLYHFPNEGHLLSAASNIIVADIVSFFLIFPLNRLALSKEKSLRNNDAVFAGLGCYNLELDGLEGALGCE